MSEDHKNSIKKRFPKCWNEFKKTGLDITFKNLETWYRSKGEVDRHYAISLSKLETKIQ